MKFVYFTLRGLKLKKVKVKLLIQVSHGDFGFQGNHFFYLLYSVDDLLCNVIPTVVEVFQLCVDLFGCLVALVHVL